jgi:long-chain acyl-CoA synthetase
VAVFGVPDPDLGETIAAHIQLQPGADVSVADVRRHAREHHAAYKAPTVVVFEDELPREETGKLFKRRLRERYL